MFKESTLQRIIGDEAVEAVEILRSGAIKPFQMAVGGVLVRIGVEPNNELFGDQLRLDERGYVAVDERAGNERRKRVRGRRHLQPARPDHQRRNRRGRDRRQSHRRAPESRGRR